MSLTLCAAESPQQHKSRAHLRIQKRNSAMTWALGNIGQHNGRVQKRSKDVSQCEHICAIAASFSLIMTSSCEHVWFDSSSKNSEACNNIPSSQSTILAYKIHLQTHLTIIKTMRTLDPRSKIYQTPYLQAYDMSRKFLFCKSNESLRYMKVL